MNKAQANITDEIERFGVISFARFMDLALYCPVYGYYEKEGDRIGRTGDFYTSSTVGDVFGELLAFQFASWLKEISGLSCQIFEAGAHDGRLAAAILGWVRSYEPELFAKLQYGIVEPSDARWSRQRERLREFEGKIFRATGFEAFAEPGLSGIIFSNELLDAMPVHRLAWDARERKWFEWGVGLQGGRFAWRKMGFVHSGCRDGTSGSLAEMAEVPPALLNCWPDGFTIETGPTAERWWRAAAAALREGKLITLDYGLESEEFFAPERSQGTLRAYSKHHISSDVLANPGEQDITSHVNFGVLRRAGEQLGLRTDALVRQEQFLLGIVRRMSESGARFPAWTGDRAGQLQTLTHPEHLGRAFSVLVQSRTLA